VTPFSPYPRCYGREAHLAKEGLDDATCAAGIGCLVLSYRKNHEQKKLFYVPMKFIFPNG
jgi:hypothetical protein